jgi:predicted nucleotidyltransferase
VVHLFGSHASNGSRKGSDVDFAVTGLPPKAFFRALGEAMEPLGRPVDLVDLDQSTPFTEHLKSQGELVRLFEP